MKYFCLLLTLCIYLIPVQAQTPEQTYFEWTTLPFTQEELKGRRTHIIEILQRQNKNGVVVIPARDGFSYGETFRQLDDFYYFTGLEIPNALLIIDMEKGQSIIYSPQRDKRFESGSRPNDFPGRPLADDPEISELAQIDIRPISKFKNEMELAEGKSRTIYINSGRPGPIAYSSSEYIATYSPTQILLNALKEKHPNLEHENIYASIAIARMIKSKAEIANLRKATDITVQGIKTSARSIRPGVDERYLEGVLEGDFKINGANRLAFGSIIKSGPNSLWPWRILATHYNRRNRIIQDGDLVIFDVGCEYNHYVSDVGRTFPVSGKFTTHQKAILEMETKVADQIIAFIKPGISFLDIKKLTDKIIPDDAKKYMQVGLFFGHHLGLSTGDPNISTATLQPGMVFTVEPWYYNHDNGVSVFTEDIILVTEDGCEVLSAALPRTPEEIEAMMKE